MNERQGGIRFLFDYISPNAYIAWVRIHELAARFGREVEPVPVLFAGLLQAHGLLGPAEVESKWRWMLKDVLRKGHQLDIPFQPPASHPFNSLLALRISQLPLEPDMRIRLIDKLFDAVWAHSVDVSDPAAVASLAQSLGLDGAKAVEDALAPSNKARLRRSTEDAVREGVFGVPTMQVDGENFWGFDDFKHLELVLADQDPVRKADLAAWDEVRPSARRPRPE